MASDCQFWRKPCDCDKAPGIACCGTDSARDNCHFYQRARADALEARLTECDAFRRNVEQNWKATWPRTWRQAMKMMYARLTDEEIEEIRGLSDADAIQFHHGYGRGIRNLFGLWCGNDDLIRDCGYEGQPLHEAADGASQVLIKHLFGYVQDLHGVAETPEVTERDQRLARRLSDFLRLRNEGGWPARYENATHAVWGEHERADALAAENEKLREALEGLEGMVTLLVRWQEHAQECEPAVKLAWSHGVEIPPTTIGEDTDKALAAHEARKKALTE